jgi:hypothetical protein
MVVIVEAEYLDPRETRRQKEGDFIERSTREMPNAKIWGEIRKDDFSRRGKRSFNERGRLITAQPHLSPA